MKNRIFAIFSFFMICLACAKNENRNLIHPKFYQNISFQIEKALYFTKNFYKKPEITLIGRVKMADGLGQILVTTAEQLSKHHHVELYSYDNILKNVPKSLHPMVKFQPKTINGKIAIYFDPIWLGEHRFQKEFDLENIFFTDLDHSQIRIAYSMYEASKIPQEWVIKLNHYFDYVLVPDVFLKKVYIDSGVTKPIHVLPLGTDLSEYLNSPIKKERNSQFTFGNLSACIERKNLKTLVKAFQQAFRLSNKAVLKISCRNGHSEYIDELNNLIGENRNVNIFFEVQELPQERYSALLKSFDCLVQLSKGEGFSIQPREAMACGIPVICTNNTSQTTLCKSQLVYSIDSPIIENAFSWFTGKYVGYQYGCLVDDVARALIDMYENYDRFLIQSQAEREYASKFDKKNFGKTFNAFIEDISRSLIAK